MAAWRCADHYQRMREGQFRPAIALSVDLSVLLWAKTFSRVLAETVGAIVDVRCTGQVPGYSV